ncbi:MAG: hypothetical protein Q9164_002291 [Protoblastenia rupestris]
MGFLYHFVSLTEDQNQRRRSLLDNYGQFAQLSVLLLPLIYQLSSGIRLIFQRLQRRAGYQLVKEHQSPVANRFKVNAVARSSWSWSRISWLLDEEIAPGWETRKECLIAFLWAAWLLLLATKDTGDDYLHLTKRFGIVAASQLPVHYFLAAKAWSPIQFLTRVSHEELNPYHRLLGRIIVLFFTCHASLYLNFYIQKGLLSKRIRDWDVILGLLAISSALLLFTTALARIRHYNYRLFFYLHVLLSASLLPVLYFHVTHLRIYILEAALIYILIILQRNLSQTPSQATITLLPSTNLLNITIPLTPSLRSKTYARGQHIYLSLPSLKQKLRINPFTIANNPAQDGSIQLVARSLNGTTAMLNTLASQQPQPTNLLIEGPYGSAKYFPDLTIYDQVLLVAGGVGATFTMPIYRHLLDSGAGDLRVRFVWTVRDIADAAWGIQMLETKHDRDGFAGLELHVTGPGVAGHGSRGKDEDDEEGGMELQERQSVLSEDEGVQRGVKYGRPDLHAIVDETFEHDPSDRVAVLVCGTKGMGGALRREVGKRVARGREVFWHSEEFGW